jgi:DNA-binding MarR family transcriptional regulator
MCRDREMTVAAIGRELGISRQGAAKIVAGLRERGYVRVTPSSTSGREKSVVITPRSKAYLSAQRAAARRIERNLRRQLGTDAFDALQHLCAVLAPADDVRLRDYLRERGVGEL